MKKHSVHLYGTLGPACASEEMIRAMFLSGMTGMRINLSHTHLSACEGWLYFFQKAADTLHLVPELLVDLQGPELRIGKLAAPLSLAEGDTVFLCPESKLSEGESPKERFPLADADRLIPCPAKIFPHAKEGRKVHIDDGKITLLLKAASPDGSFPAAVVKGGVLPGKKSIAIEGVRIPLPVLTEADKENLALLRKYRVTGVMLPFVRCADDLIALRRELHANGLDYIRIFAKLETIEGVQNLPSLLPFCDEIIIARGDLGNAIPLPKLPALQSQISATCRRAKKPFMVVTQLLASMEEHPVPTRAEVNDIFHAVLDGASSLMLTGETAIGSYPREAMQTLSQTSDEALRFAAQRPFLDL